MNARDFAGQQNVLELHQPGDWQPAFDAARPSDLRAAPAVSAQRTHW